MWRPESVGRQIQGELSELIQNRLKDPRIGYFTLTGVRMTKDLKVARVYVSVMGGEADQDSTLEGLGHAAAFLRRELGKRLQLRNVPELVFSADNSIERGARINKLLDELDS